MVAEERDAEQRAQRACRGRRVIGDAADHDRRDDPQLEADAGVGLHVDEATAVEQRGERR